MNKTELQIPKWIKEKYTFEEKMVRNTQILYSGSGMVGIVKKNSYFCKELRVEWTYTPFTFQYLLEQCKFEGDLIFFSNEATFYYPHIHTFIWLFNPKYAIIEVNLSEETPLIISSPHIDFELVLAPRISEE